MRRMLLMELIWSWIELTLLSDGREIVESDPRKNIWLWHRKIFEEKLVDRSWLVSAASDHVIIIKLKRYLQVITECFGTRGISTSCLR